MDTPKVTVHIDENGAISAVEVAGHASPAEFEVTVPSEPVTAFGDQELKERLRPWVAGA